ncbi:aminopeptidase [Haloarchaeobius sp. HME9146]|uniref:aminopeptidase n=1 Tax=Haloarchaeobius sp. HME9146 TaxID=2978732 RepID=UPI0021BE26D1|nr:aminopeptidase [Haloarchaeobius sp. HME9146]MCT9095619.1 aminopeptidase [Haloarchaeobius sp. HME9146]
MDSRIEQHADILVNHSTNIQPGDKVIVAAPPEASDLVAAVFKKLGEVGARPVQLTQDSRAMREFVLAVDPETLDLPEHLQALMDETDVLIGISGSSNKNETSDVPPEKIMALAKLNKPIQDAMMEKRWVGTQFPATGDAQKAEMSTPAYEDFVWGAINRDWGAQRELQQQVVDRLDDADEVRIVSGDTTDLTMSIRGNLTKNDFGENNLPGGEVFTAPVPDSVEGEVLFDKPLMAQGREVTGVRLVFEQGEVVEYEAEKNEELLAAVLNTDDGARRIGELGIGMNRDIDRFTYNMLFDEKMGDTIHLAIGRAIEGTVGEGVEFNDSAVHMDMIVDMSQDSYIEVDGEVIQRDGKFWFEE